VTDQVISVPHFTPTFSEALEATWYASLGNLRKTGISVGALLVASACSIFAHGDSGWLFPLFSTALVFIVGGLTIWFAFAIFAAALRLSKCKEPSRCTGYEFSAEGVDIASDTASVHISWPGLHRFRRSKRLLMFSPRASRALMFVPLRCIEERNRQPLEKLLLVGCKRTE
jgi:hypothetical protein